MRDAKRIVLGGLAAVVLVAGLAGSAKADTFVWVSGGDDVYVSTPSSWSYSYYSYRPYHSSSYREVSYRSSYTTTVSPWFDVDDDDDVRYSSRTTLRTWSYEPRDSYYSSGTYFSDSWE